jgi:hypothetical protein
MEPSLTTLYKSISASESKMWNSLGSLLRNKQVKKALLWAEAQHPGEQLRQLLIGQRRQLVQLFHAG